MRESGERYATRIPADVDRPDVIVARLTARQVVILAGTGLAVWAAFMAAHTALPNVPPVYLIAPAAPVAAIAIGLALGKRDGLTADRFALAALRHGRTPKHLVAGGSEQAEPLPQFLGKALRSKAGPVPVPVSMPGHGIDANGVIDLGSDGHAAVAACGTVNFALRTPGEQDALVASFGRWLNGLTAPVQLLVRTHRLDLTDAVQQLREAAPGLPHPALEQAAAEHADYLQALAGRRDVLHRQVLLAAREPRTGRKGRAGSADASAPQRLHRRLDEAARALAGSQIAVRAFDDARLRHLLIDATGAGREPTTEGEGEG
ncbi:PrgI family protein [Catenulispora pinisilvae]|uniref:PrgI family protein n=1 Tax=Catenulispora pinisilvae TaxID=2705253 RepID=UPI001890ED0C|nr:PrgI family protein [Catenulispora pinisilvae]